MIKLLRIVGGNEENQEERLARSVCATAGASVLDRFEAAGGDAALVAQLRQLSMLRSETPDNASSSLAQLRLSMMAAEREAVIALRDRNEINDTVMRQLFSEFDHEELLLTRE